MDEMKLRALVREEIERVLDDELNSIDSHPKFRRLVEIKLGRSFVSTDERWNETYEAWMSVLHETEVKRPDQDVIDYYVDDVVRAIRSH